ncbi:MAG: hypothetical protein OSB41_00985 [Kiritimatiellae bacterium]|nr:hypothetical protein [Kiritimatiellia bacterium]
MVEMSERESGGFENWMFGLLLLLPALYLFSYGPMSSLYYNSSIDAFDMVFDIVYLPIDLLYTCTPMDVPIDWWENVWD